MMTAEMAAGTPGVRSAGGTAWRAIWQCTNSMGSAAANGSTPVTIWYRVTPNAYRSLRASTERFIRPVCSGAMYASVPAMISGGSGAWRSRGRREAMPKPVSHTCPAAESTITLAGLMSL